MLLRAFGSPVSTSLSVSAVVKEKEAVVVGLDETAKVAASSEASAGKKEDGEVKAANTESAETATVTAGIATPPAGVLASEYTATTTTTASPAPATPPAPAPSKPSTPRSRTSLFASSSNSPITPKTTIRNPHLCRMSIRPGIFILYNTLRICYACRIQEGKRAVKFVESSCLSLALVILLLSFGWVVDKSCRESDYENVWWEKIQVEA
ncbi:hypothetical protein NP233_g2475 [Leucocoprinus birnbaumii]|uniref:Uncharacterized protein n=1 Tax=Leucocoprinus birnbaumii TaxID=56174 RepID=A0AAD5VYV6_9AGAR|nr:hypothetical protein NP233_g2475 [Leucocoprinus birnbaumii]